jgi:hypothetical protein
MVIDLDRYRNKATRLASSYSGGEFQQLKDGKNVIRVFTFDHVVTQRDFERGLYAKGTAKVGQTHTEIEREIKTHLSEGEKPLKCTGKDTCERCLQIKELEQGSAADKKLAKRLAARNRFTVNAVSMDDDESAMKLFELPLAVYSAILNYLNSGEYGAAELFGPEGRDFIIQRDSKANQPSKMYSVQLRDKNKCTDLPAEMQDSVIDLYDFALLDVTADASLFDPAKIEAEEREVKNNGKGKAEKATEKPAKEEKEKFGDKPAAGKAASDVGKDAYFEHEGKQYAGKISSVKGNTFEVDTGDEVWELERNDFSFEAPKTETKRRKK